MVSDKLLLALAGGGMIFMLGMMFIGGAALACYNGNGTMTDFSCVNIKTVGACNIGDTLYVQEAYTIPFNTSVVNITW